jgi:hypothetical protein
VQLFSGLNFSFLTSFGFVTIAHQSRFPFAGNLCPSSEKTHLSLSHTFLFECKSGQKFFWVVKKKEVEEGKMFLYVLLVAE